jgi:gamma-glutamyl hydrolase
MNSLQSSNILLFTFLCLSLSLISCETAQKPIIGILSTPSDLHDHYDPQEFSYIKNSYAEFIEAAGGEAIAIPWDLPERQLITLLNSINGVLFTGGDATLWEHDYETDDVEFSNFTKRAIFILNYVIHLNDKGIHYPLYGICQGHEIITMGIAGNHDIIDHYRHPGQLDTVNILAAGKESRMFKGMDDEISAFMRQERSVFYNHRFGFNMSLLEENKALDAFFTITAKGADDKGKEFVAAMEAKEYPIFTVQYHPERVLSEWKNKTVFSHPEEAVEAILHQGNFFVNEAKKNQNSFSNEKVKKVFALESHEHVYLNITWPKTFFYDQKSPIAYHVDPEWADCNGDSCELDQYQNCDFVNVDL